MPQKVDWTSRFAASRLFTQWHDPETGVCSYILTKLIAPLQQSFYFTNTSRSADGRYYWFYAAHPPSGNADQGRTLGVIDFEADALQWFPDTQFRDASPWIDPQTAYAYWCSGYAVYRRAPNPEAEVELVNAIPEEIHKNRYGKRLATHLTISADGHELFIDAHFGNEWCAGSLPLDGGDFELWQKFDRCFNHAQFSPTNPDQALLAQDWWIDGSTGEKYP